MCLALGGPVDSQPHEACQSTHQELAVVVPSLGETETENACGRRQAAYISYGLIGCPTRNGPSENSGVAVIGLAAAHNGH